jgi:antitoxin component YwqK of YwqJK toxin-antitoxin module
MKIIKNILVLCFLIGCKTSNNLVREGGEPCAIMVLPPNTEYVFYNWYKADSSVCEVSSFKIKDLQGYRKGYFKDGMQSGKWTSDRYFFYDSLGYSRSKDYLAREEYFKNGLRDSIYKIYNKEGKIIYSTFFKNGSGKEKDFYENGNLYYEIELRNGFFSDTLKLYNDKGKLKEELFYNKDSLVFRKNMIIDVNPTDNKP